MPDGGANGVIIAQGGAFGGCALYAKDGRPAYCYNLFGLAAVQGRTATSAIPAGEHQVRMEFTYDGGGLGKGGDVTLYVDGEPGRRGPRRRDRADAVLRRRDDRRRERHGDARSATTTASTDSEFTGTVRWVQIDLDAAAEDTDHLITPEERLRVAMARQ